MLKLRPRPPRLSRSWLVKVKTGLLLIKTSPSREAVSGLAIVLVALAAGGAARAQTGSDAVASATVAVQAVEPTGDGRARVSDCSGALIAPDLVLTAGHCLDLAADRSRVAVFAYRDGKPVPSPLPVAAIARHPDHVRGWREKAGDPETRAKEISADLALIRLASPVEGARPLEIAALPPSPGMASGVGANGAGGRSGAIKRIALTGVRASTGGGATVVFGTASQAVCGGDSGGPVVAASQDGKPTLWAVVSAVLKPRGGCGTRIAATPLDPASPGFRAMRAAVGR